ncbi:MAG TPA: ABC transporter ATP-binding protein [Iamia sp.]|nr:ABC transporter ATP-binding protein [Iamia sp.]
MIRPSARRVPPPGDDRVSDAEAPRIVARAVERRFDDGRAVVSALGPLDLEVGEGEFVSVVGPSGCGKSTLLRIIAGLIAPSSGEIEIGRNDPDRTLMAMVFQDHSVYPWKTVERNVRFGLDVERRGSRAERDRLVAEYLERLGLSAFARAYPQTLSGGMRQRVAIARALVLQPELLLMDEPFASLDAQLKRLMQDDLAALWENERRTMVFVTHSIDEAIYLSDRVVVMSARPGRICADFAVPFARPRSHEIRAEPEFAALQQEIWEVLRDEVDRHLQQSEAVHRGAA